MQKKWWQEAVVYQIYCKSFCDTNGDGIGDLPGVISKLPMLKELGINCIWFTPIYTSPQVDNGYDVANYRDIDPAYGTLEDFKTLLDQAHAMGIRVIMDQVLNHSSDECEWFRESRKSKDNPYRDYYIWQPPKADGTPPNNWGNYFRDGNGSAWEFDETTGEYYLHQYAVKMPDLNWECAALRREIYDMLRFWLDLGVDGFRLDIFTRFQKPKGFPDTKKEPDVLLDRNGYIVDTSMCTNVEGIHSILHELYTEVFGPRDCMTVGEGAGVTSKNALDYICQAREEVNMVYHFELAGRKCPPVTPARFRSSQKAWAELMDYNAWPVQYFSNHDNGRQVSRHGDDQKYRVESAKALATLLHTTPGTPFVYQGEEIGMTNVKYDSIEDYRCCYTIGDYPPLIAGGKTPAEALNFLAPLSRDNARTPYQWNTEKNAGFSEGTPWIKVNPNYKEINLAADRAREDSIFAYYQALIRMRSEHPAIIDGDLRFYLEEDENLVVYRRKCARETLLVLVNLSGNERSLTLPEEILNHSWKTLLSNQKAVTPLEEKQTLSPWEAVVLSLER